MSVYLPKAMKEFMPYGREVLIMSFLFLFLTVIITCATVPWVVKVEMIVIVIMTRVVVLVIVLVIEGVGGVITNVSLVYLSDPPG